MVSQKTYVEGLDERVDSILDTLYKNSRDPGGWVTFIRGCFLDNDVYKKLANVEFIRLNDVEFYVNKHARNCEAAGQLYSDLENALKSKFRGEESGIETYGKELRIARVFEKNCNETCNPRSFLIEHIAEYTKRIEATSQRRGVRETAVKEKLYVDLSQRLSQWYPNREDFQQSLMKVSTLKEFNKPPRPEGILSNRSVFEDYMVSFLDSSDYKQKFQKDIKDRIVNILSRYTFLAENAEAIVTRLDLKSELMFLDDRDLEEQTRQEVENTFQIIFDEFKAKLENNLMNWYPNNNLYYLNLINSPDLAWVLFRAAADTDTNKNSFERNIIAILDSPNWKSVREAALKTRIESALINQHAGFKNYHRTVLYIMEHRGKNEMQANLLFDDANLESRVQKAVETTEKEVRDSYLNRLWVNIKFWYPNSIAFNRILYGIANIENFFLKPNAETIQSSKTVFENHIKPFLKSPDFAVVVEIEIQKRIGSMLVGQYSAMSEYEITLVEKTLLASEPQTRVDMLFNYNDFKEKFQTAITVAINENKDIALAKLKANLNAWLPKSQEFVEKFVLFIKKSRPSLKAMENFDKRDFILSGPIFTTFSANEKDLVDRTIANEIREVLKTIDHGRTERNFDILQKKNPEMFQVLTDVTILESRIKRTIQPIQNCITTMPTLVDSILVAVGTNQEDKADLKKYFESNKCFADEICVKTNGISTEVNTELQLYIDAYRKSRDNPLSANINIKTELDLSVYGVVQSIVQSNGKVDETLGECFVEYLTRSNDLDAIYSRDLLFEQDELKTKIKPFVEKYESDYLRSMG